MFNLLAISTEQITMYVILGVLIVAIVVMFVFSSRRRKKQEQDAQNLINAVKPGNKVKTIGGICGICVEVDEEENTIVLETGTETTGKSYIKFDRQAIYQTDAVVEEKPAANEAEEEPSEEQAKEQTPAAEKTEEKPAEAEPAKDQPEDKKE